MREVPKCAKSQNARSPRMREVPNSAKSQNAPSPKRRLTAADATFVHALRNAAPFSALWDFAHYGTSRRLMALSGGRIWAATLNQNRVGRFAELLDIREDRPEERTPPPSASHW